MEEKNFVVGIFIGLIFGGIIGFIVAPKSNTIEVNNPNLEIETSQEKNQEWKILKEWKGASDKDTEIFYVSGNMRIQWVMTPQEQVFGLWITIHSEKPNEYGLTFVKGWSIQDRSGTTYAHLEPGRYYVEIGAMGCQYEITVEVKI